MMLAVVRTGEKTGRHKEQQEYKLKTKLLGLMRRDERTERCKERKQERELGGIVRKTRNKIQTWQRLSEGITGCDKNTTRLITLRSCLMILEIKQIIYLIYFINGPILSEKIFLCRSILYCSFSLLPQTWKLIVEIINFSSDYIHTKL